MHRIASELGEAKSGEYLMRCLSVAVQRGMLQYLGAGECRHVTPFSHI